MYDLEGGRPRPPVYQCTNVLIRIEGEREKVRIFVVLESVHEYINKLITEYRLLITRDDENWL
jgi:hypothetical protein